MEKGWYGGLIGGLSGGLMEEGGGLRKHEGVRVYDWREE